MNNGAAALLALLFFAPLAFVYGRQVAGGLHRAVLVGDALRVRVLAFFPAPIARNGIGGGHGGAQRHAALFHQFEDFGRAAVTVLDGFDAG